MKTKLTKGILFLVMLLSALSLSAGQVRLVVEMPRGRRSIAVGDDFWIKYIVTDMDAAPSRPASVPGCDVRYFNQRGSSSSFSSVNGRVTQSYSAEYAVMLHASKEGKYTFGPVTVGGVRSNTVSYTIGAKGSNSAGVPGQPVQQSNGSKGNSAGQGPKFIGKGDSQLFLKANISKTTAYEQEALVYTVKLYTTYSGIRFIGAAAAPTFDGFVIEESKDVSQQLDYETYNGKSYATAVIARYIIFPQMTGNLKIIGNTYTVSVNELEYYHDPYFGTQAVSNPIQLNVTPNDLQINVQPLPQPQPADFSGGVGSFTITSSLPSKDLKSNQAASVIYTVKGSGNLKYVKLPDLNAAYPAQLEVYSPTNTLNTTVTSTTLTGENKFDYSFMPLEPGDYDIPDVTLVYFNPVTGKYERSVAKGYKVSVGKGDASSRSQTRDVNSFDDKLMPHDLENAGSLYVRSWLYWLWYLIPVLILITVMIVYRRYLKEHSDLELLKSKRAGKVALRRLRKAQAALKKDNAELFYDEMLSALWGYLGDKLQIPVSELNRDNVSMRLSSRNIPETTTASLIELIDDCEFAKYAPSSAHDSMGTVFDRATSVIGSLENSFKK